MATSLVPRSGPSPRSDAAASPSARASQPAAAEPSVGVTPEPSAGSIPGQSTAAAPGPTQVPQPTPMGRGGEPPIPTPAPTAAPTPTHTPPVETGWRMVINDQFASGGVPAHWDLYNGPYGSGPHNCAIPSHATVSSGSLHMLMRYEESGICGAGWYTAGMMIGPEYGSVDQRVTVRFRIVSQGVSSHYIIPMRWPTTVAWPLGGEEDYCEGDDRSGCNTYLHYGASNEQEDHAYSFDLAELAHDPRRAP